MTTPNVKDAPEYRLMDAAALERYLNLPKATIYSWVCLRKIPAECIVKLGRTLRFDREAVDRWIESAKPTRGG